jgi:hypothetical protein
MKRARRLIVALVALGIAACAAPSPSDGVCPELERALSTDCTRDEDCQRDVDCPVDLFICNEELGICEDAPAEGEGEGEGEGESSMGGRSR